MNENHDRMLEKLDLIFRLSRDCNAALRRIESRGKSRHINSVPSDDAREPEVVEAEPELEIVDEPEPDLEVDEPDPKLEVKESLIETLVDFSVEHIMNLLPSSPDMRVPLFLRSSDVYDPLQIFLNEASS